MRPSNQIGGFSVPHCQGRKTPKKVKRDEEEGMEDLIAEARGMGPRDNREDRRRDVVVDISTIHETVMTRINETLTAYQNKEGEPDSPLLKQLLPALATAVSVAVGEVMRGIVKNLDERFNQRGPTTTETRLLQTATLLTDRLGCRDLNKGHWSSIETPDDLFERLGMETVDFHALGHLEELD
ncbi:hypothetical protein ACOMHN_058693 [Nucella lapillus]